MAFIQRGAEPGDALEIGEIERHQSSAAAVTADGVVEFLETALGSRHRDHMGALPRQRACGGIADTARGAGDESDPGGEGKGHDGELMIRYTAKIKRSGDAI